MTFSQFGGARLGTFNATWPLAKLVASPEELKLWVLGIKLAFPKASITRLSKHSGFISTGLRIEHSNPRAPQFIVFWTFDFPTLAKELALLGYQTSWRHSNHEVQALYRLGGSVSTPISGEATYTLACLALDGTTITKSVSVNIIPTFQEN